MDNQALQRGRSTFWIMCSLTLLGSVKWRYWLYKYLANCKMGNSCFYSTFFLEIRSKLFVCLVTFFWSVGSERAWAKHSHCSHKLWSRAVLTVFRLYLKLLVDSTCFCASEMECSTVWNKQGVWEWCLQLTALNLKGVVLCDCYTFIIMLYRRQSQ